MKERGEEGEGAWGMGLRGAPRRALATHIGAARGRRAKLSRPREKGEDGEEGGGGGGFSTRHRRRTRPSDEDDKTELAESELAQKASWRFQC